MSNVKAVSIEGIMPFDAGGNRDLISVIGSIHLPGFGLSLEYGHTTTMVPNEHGGQTTMYPYRLHGQEAISWGFLDRFTDLIKKVGGTVDVEQVIDMEG